MRPHLLALTAALCCVVAGCHCDQPQPVRIVRVTAVGCPDSCWYTLQGPQTVIEFRQSRVRKIVPGVLGEVGDEFLFQQQF